MHRGKKMKERPILFNSEMVKAVLSGQKTQTRRVIKPGISCTFDLERDGSLQIMVIEDTNGDFVPILDFCPYGRIGDQLWVRETFMLETENGVPTGGIIYRATDLPEPDGDRKLTWKPSIFMNRKYSRIQLEITSVRVERVQDITDHGAIAEGIISQLEYEDNAGSENLFDCPDCSGFQVHECLGENMGMSECECKTCDTPKKRFSIIWNSIYKNWDANPWVWVVEFKRIDK